MNRRQAIGSFLQFIASSPLFAEHPDPLLKQVNVFDFAKLAKAKLDPVAWDYLDEGSDDEISLHANREDFDNIAIRPHFLRNDVSKIDTSITLFGKQLKQPIYLTVTGGKNCFVPNGERESALAARTADSMMIMSGGVGDLLSSGKGPRVWWQYTTAAEFRSKSQMAAFAEKLEDQGCSAISVTVFPDAIRDMTSYSRSDSVSCGVRVGSFVTPKASFSAKAGLTYRPPAIILRMAFAKSSGALSFAR